ncbi:class I SAM-dependent methyltransferase [Arenimonas aestuarii]
MCNRDFEPGLLSYDPSYQNEQAHSEAFQSHLAEVLAVVGRHFRGTRILEVGCGKGRFLGMMRAQGHDAIGIDPAYEGDDPGILKRHFTPDAGVRGDAIVLRHTLEHLDDPVGFLDGLRESNGGRGLIYIEVPCLDWILARRAWFDFFYEHVNYFRPGDFQRLFGRVLEAGHLFGGQYLYAVADLATLRTPASLPPATPVTVPAELFGNIHSVLARAADGHRTVVWGAAAKGVMFCHHARAHGLDVSFAIDINPAKQGCFLAGSGIEVLSPADGLPRLAPGDHVVVMNSNYLDEITRAGGPHLDYIPMDNP